MSLLEEGLVLRRVSADDWKFLPSDAHHKFDRGAALHLKKGRNARSRVIFCGRSPSSPHTSRSLRNIKHKMSNAFDAWLYDVFRPAECDGCQSVGELEWGLLHGSESGKNQLSSQGDRKIRILYFRISTTHVRQYCGLTLFAE